MVFVGAGEDGLGVGADRDYSAVVGACEVHSGKNHLTGNACGFIALYSIVLFSSRIRAILSIPPACHAGLPCWLCLLRSDII